MTRPLEFGINYLPHVERIRDFFPHWVEPVWTKELVTRDLKIMRAQGCRWMRFHILPVNYDKDHYPGASADMYRQLVPHCLKTAHALGMKTHIDLHTDDFPNIRIEDILARIAEFGAENIDVLQIINEYFYLWKRPENLDRQLKLFDQIRASGFRGHLCFDAGGSVHRTMRKTHPRLAAYFAEMIPLHHYPHNAEWDE